MPVFFVGREPDHIARPNVLDRSAPPLRAATPRRDDESLTEWMRVPYAVRAPGSKVTPAP